MHLKRGQKIDNIDYWMETLKEKEGPKRKIYLFL